MIGSRVGRVVYVGEGVYTVKQTFLEIKWASM